mmetsp:Transcript_54629/g.130367  ORF Transcript_54629/g.130367 Transcript_54629/m.130367 type:complete len:286 (-) Transcript_54629:168-1025(-)|eukprot:CAMPEP_0178419618 /NCGR_PEP_ID=MMETSP0689_2-20121128/25704_1 /TAXON_ID=160604 /ORGANISM="Amphidinium massartii, Strain CS-259" /LENGTH=285 /DNA_ID=CAMNT_0020041063 /DNA_START=11 /DNA_END=871 /DNA_ORIENTATION=-
MGNFCMNLPHKNINKPVADGENYDRNRHVGDVKVLMVVNDYKNTPKSLSCGVDGQHMRQLLQACGVSSITSVLDNQCTKGRVRQAVRQVCSSCAPDDYFLFYYSGHGHFVRDLDGDEADHFDEAFVCVDEQGQIKIPQSLYIDDEFHDDMVAALHPDTRVLLITDCCHSGTIADLDKPDMEGREAILLAGCLDPQTSGDLKRTQGGGIFTHSLLLAVQRLSQMGETECSVGRVFNETLEVDDEVFLSPQDLAIQCCLGHSPDQMAWPLIPRAPYQAPYVRPPPPR